MIGLSPSGPAGARVSRAPTVLLAAYIALLPLDWSPLPLNSKWCDLVFLAVGAVWLARWSWRDWRPKALDWLVVLYVAGSVVAIRPEYGWGPALVALTKQVALFLVYVVFTVIARRGGAELTSRLLVVTAAAYAAMGCLALVVFVLTGWSMAALGRPMVLPYLGETFRLDGATHSPEMFACFLTVAIALAVVPAIRVTLHTRLAAIAAVTTAGLGTFAHSIAGAILAAALASRSALGHQRVLGSTLLSAAVVALIVVNVALLVTFRDVTFGEAYRTDMALPREPYAFQDARGARVANVQVTYNWVSYFLLKRVAWDAFLTEPWRGAGLGRFHELTERAHHAGQLSEVYRRIDPHSTPMGRLAETGLIGGVTLVALWVGAFAAVHRLQSRTSVGPLAAGLLAGLAGLAANAVNVDVMNFRFLWIGLGLIRGLTELDEHHAGAVAV